MILYTLQNSYLRTRTNHLHMRFSFDDRSVMNRVATGFTLPFGNDMVRDHDFLSDYAILLERLWGFEELDLAPLRTWHRRPHLTSHLSGATLSS